MNRAEPVHDLGRLIERTHGNAAFALVALKNLDALSAEHGLSFASAAQQAFHDRLAGLLRETDQFLLISSDRACVVFDQLLDDNHVLLAGLKIERAFESPVSVAGHAARLDVRAGLIYYGRPERLSGLDAEDLYRFADSALARAVEQGAAFEISSEDAFAEMQRDWQINHELGEALNAHEVTLDYQPKYRLSDGELVGAEAIIRWRRGGRIVPPEEFLPILNPDQLWSLTVYSLRRLIRETSELGTDIPIAMSIDGRILRRPDFLVMLRSELSIWGLPQGRIALEVRESRFDDAQTLGMLEELRAIGVAVIIDEFGRGAASLEKLRDLPVDEIKIDPSFVTQLVDNEQDRQMTCAIIDLAHRFEKTVTADGVEDGETFTFLAEAGCDVGQGFYLSAPLNQAQFVCLTSAAVV